MSHRQCRVAGCGKPARSRYGTYCHAHAMRKVRHGHPEQKGVTITELAPFRREITAFLDRRGDALMEPLRAIYRDFVEAIRGSLEAMRKRPRIRWERQAHECILRVADEPTVTADDVIKNVTALWLLYQRQPRRFKTHQAFLVQMARTHRRMTDSHVAEHYRHTTGKVHRVFRDYPRRTSEVHGALLNKIIGTLAVGIVSQMAEEEERRFRNRQAALKAISGGEMT